MRIHVLQHVPFEDEANIGVWASQRGYAVTRSRLYADDPLPTAEQIDWLVVMGGPMNVYEQDRHPWLREEKACVERAIDKGLRVVGVCLGAQLIANVLGARVVRGDHTEIGWHEVTLTTDAKNTALCRDWPDRFTAFHWHGDTFEIPAGATRIAHSQACANQAFAYAGHVVALQFHIEYSAKSIHTMLARCTHELVDGPFIQSREQILTRLGHVDANRHLLYTMLDNLANIN